MNETPAAQPDDPRQEDAPSNPVSLAGSENTRRAEPRDSWIWGAVLIILGGLFLIQNFSTFHLVNWWAVFIFVPALGSFIAAWRRFQEAGRLSASARNALFGGIIFSGVGLIFLLNLDLGRWWPVFLVAAGLSVLTNAIFPDS